MKKLFFLFVCAAIAAACNSEMEVPSPVNPDDDMVEVSFNLAGDYVSVEETPMTRADEGKTYYMIKIFSKNYYILTGHKVWYDEYYAYGLFTSMEHARIRIPKGSTYCYEALVVKEQEDKISLSDGVLGDPFSKQVTDKFIYNEDLGGPNPDGGPLLKRTGAYLARYDRFYGEIEKTVNDTGDITIPLDRYNFSFTFNVAPPVDGKVVISSGNKVLYEKGRGDKVEAHQIIYNAPHDESTKDTAIPVELNIKWVRASSEAKEYSVTETINVERKKNYTINVDMNGREDENNFGFEFDDENFVEDKSFNIN